MLVSLYTSRVVLNTLGVEDYGTYAIVGGIVGMFGVFNGAMAGATQRFLSFELGRKDYVQLRKTFNAAQIIHIAIAFLVLVLAETVGLWFVVNYLRIPDKRMEAALWVYHFSILSFMVSIIQAPYNAVIIARERMNVYAYVSILEVLLKLIIVFMLTWIAFDKLKLYGILVFVVTIIIAATYRVYASRNFEETRFDLIKDKALYKTLISYSGWNLWGNLASVAKAQGVSIILNIFFGTVINAAQGIANQIYVAINSFVMNFQMASNPQIVKSYASNDKEYMNNLVVRTSKFSFYLLFVLSLPIVLEVDYVLELWLKIVPEYTSVFTILVLINALIDTLSGPLMISLQATGKIKVYQSVVGIMLILILPISYLLFKLGFSPQSTFVVSICIAILALFVRLYLTKKEIPEFSVGMFVQDVLVRSLPVVMLTVCIPYLIKLTMDMGFVRFLVVSVTSLLSSLTLIYFLGLKKNEKLFLQKAVSTFIIKIKR